MGSRFSAPPRELVKIVDDYISVTELRTLFKQFVKMYNIKHTHIEPTIKITKQDIDYLNNRGDELDGYYWDNYAPNCKHMNIEDAKEYNYFYIDTTIHTLVPPLDFKLFVDKYGGLIGGCKDLQLPLSSFKNFDLDDLLAHTYNEWIKDAELKEFSINDWVIVFNDLLSNYNSNQEFGQIAINMNPNSQHYGWVMVIQPTDDCNKIKIVAHSFTELVRMLITNTELSDYYTQHLPLCVFRLGCDLDECVFNNNDSECDGYYCDGLDVSIVDWLIEDKN